MADSLGTRLLHGARLELSLRTNPCDPGHVFPKTPWNCKADCKGGKWNRYVRCCISFAIALIETGGIVYRITLRALAPHIEFGWTLQVLMLVMIVVSVIPVGGIKKLAEPPAVRHI